MSIHLHNRPLVSITWIVAVMVIASFTIYMLIPDDPALVERLVRDQNFARAQEVLQKIPDRVKRSRPEYYDTLEVSIRGKLAASAEEKVAQAKRATALLAKYPRTDIAVQEVLSAFQNLPSIDSIQTLLEHATASMTEEQRGRLAELMAARALSDGNPLLAAELFHTALPLPNMNQVKEQVRLWRMAGQPKEAVYAIDDFLVDRQTTLTGIDHQLADLFTQVLRETGENERALDVVRERLRKPNNDEEAAQLFQLLNTVAMNAGKPQEIRDDYEAWLEEHPNDYKALQSYVPILVAAGELERTAEIYGTLLKQNPSDRELSRNYAKYLEWSEQPEIAYDIYLQEAKAGNENALERLKVINPGLNRHADLADAYEAIPASYQNESSMRELAELRSYLGHYREAEDLYRRLHELNPGEISYLSNREELLRLKSDFTGCRQCLEKALKIDSNNLPVLKTYSSLLNVMGEYHTALEILRRVTEKESTPASIERYLSLATSMADSVHMACALEIQMATGKGTARDYITLAEVYGEANRSKEQLDTVTKGLKRFPDETVLKTYALFLFDDQKRFDLMRKILLTMPGLKTDPELVAQYLNAVTEMKDFAEAERFLNSGLPPAILGQRSILELSASIYETNGQLAQALSKYEQIYRLDRGSLSSTLDYARVNLDLGNIAQAKTLIRPFLNSPQLPVLELLARIAVQDKQFVMAERLQKKVLASKPGGKSQEWDTLGDILQEQGKTISARSAYRKALKARLVAR